MLTNVAVAVLLLSACTVASYLPARRAARLAPAVTIRQD
jgi:ABC-type lipoprotein release transport system permease subunit